MNHNTETIWKQCSIHYYNYPLFKDLPKSPQFYLRTMDCTGEITLPEGTEMVMPGDNVTITVELIYPVALNVGLRFAIREGGRTVGAGQITELLD